MIFPAVRIARPATALIACSALLAGCVTYNVRDGGIVHAELGQRVYVDGPHVTPLAVLEDSRCPQGVQCVWAGQVRINARVELKGGDSQRELELTLGKPVQIADGSLELVEVEPDAVANQTIYPEEYRFGFRFQGGL